MVWGKGVWGGDRVWAGTLRVTEIDQVVNATLGFTAEQTQEVLTARDLVNHVTFQFTPQTTVEYNLVIDQVGIPTLQLTPIIATEENNLIQAENATLAYTTEKTLEHLRANDEVTPANLVYTSIRASEFVEAYNVIIALTSEELIPIEFD